MTTMTDEQAIHAALEEWGAAFRNKNADRCLALYTADAVFFDAIPPFSSGVQAMREKLEQCFPHFPDQFSIEKKDVRIEVGGTLATSHFLWHFTGLPAGHPAGRHWLRTSLVWKRQDNQSWLITHDHCSAPFDPFTEKVVLQPTAEEGGSAAAAEPCAPVNPVGWFEIYVQDMERAKAFYNKVFDVTLTRLESPIEQMEFWAFPMQMDRYGTAGALVKMPDCPSTGHGALVYFHCEDCAVQAARAVEAGGGLHKAKMSIGQYGFIALVTDTEGNMIGLHSMQ
ncbi:SgcJ/EcaC family oxidoreductase [Propionivibrio soli]|uniref:SgcJ/EcaC family oxidoreductase n=1 Tax=Propionivibrio soli TaxID=2976531 RepID=UPI0021E72C21|nr:SgcJ/EcaC family oxidoreductase [Propionivibrio soli]